MAIPYYISILCQLSSDTKKPAHGRLFLRELLHLVLLLERQRHSLILWLKERNGERI